MVYRNLAELMEGIVVQAPNAIAYKQKVSGRWQAISWTDHYSAVQRVARAYHAAGVRYGDTVCIVASTRWEWVVAEMAAYLAGARAVGIYPTLLASDMAYIINHCEAKILIVENEVQLRKIVSVREKLLNLKRLIVIDPISPELDSQATDWPSFLKEGDAVPEMAVAAEKARIKPGDVATIVYTSGTTGEPKGAMITHDNLIFTMRSAERSLDLKAQYETIFFLPLAHIFGRIVVWMCAYRQVPGWFAESFDKLGENLREVRPHFFGAVPRVFEKVYAKINAGVAQAGGIKQRLFDWALSLGRKVSGYQQRKLPVPLLLNAQYAIAKALVFKKIHQAVGGRLLFAISGSAPLAKELSEFFHAAGILILEGYGMTENTGFSHVNRFENYQFGTVGQLGAGISAHIADDGEILIKGHNVMKGYLKAPEKTSEMIDREGWLHTGDIGQMDNDGFLQITDRKKDLIITSGGKNIAPARIENLLKQSPLISQAVVIGDKRHFVSALLTLDEEHVKKWAEQQGILNGSYQHLVQNDTLKQTLQAHVDGVNRELAPYETVKKFSVLDHDFSIEAGELTPTLKVRRNVVNQRYRDIVDQMYQ